MPSSLPLPSAMPLPSLTQVDDAILAWRAGVIAAELGGSDAEVVAARSAAGLELELRMYPRVEVGEPIAVAFGALFIGLAMTMPSLALVNRLVRDKETAVVSARPLACPH